MVARSEQPAWCVQDGVLWAINQLKATSEPRISARLLLAHALQCSVTDLFIHSDRILAVDQMARYRDLVAQRANHKPVAYLVGHREFLNLDFLVDERVLIPRPETELLVESVIEAAKRLSRFQRQRPLHIVDVGTGSGIIATSLAIHLPQAMILATDASGAALQVAQDNARRYGVWARMTFLHGNLLVPLPTAVDIIVANLPYVSQAEYADLPPDIRLYEPHEALVAGVDGLDAIRTLLSQARSHLFRDGTIWLETGAKQGDAVSELATRAFPDAQITVVKDYAHLDRLVHIQLPRDDQ